MDCPACVTYRRWGNGKCPDCTKRALEDEVKALKALVSELEALLRFSNIEAPICLKY